MSGSTLTSADISKLQSYANAGDRYDYWSLLASLGDKYAELALQVQWKLAVDCSARTHALRTSLCLR
jgi:hypothetical protein